MIPIMVIIGFCLSLFHAQLGLSTYSPTEPALTKADYNALVTKVNNKITTMNTMSLASNNSLYLMKNDCYQQILAVNQPNASCQEDYMINGICLVNQNQNCNYTEMEILNLEIIGSLKCCKLYQ